jgi:hypothetical protein
MSGFDDVHAVARSYDKLWTQKQDFRHVRKPFQNLLLRTRTNIGSLHPDSRR